MHCFHCVEDEDFLRVLETLTFNVGESRMCINVTILGDDIEEETERFPMQIFSPEFGQSSTIVTINDDDGQGELIHHHISSFSSLNYKQSLCRSTSVWV